MKPEYYSNLKKYNQKGQRLALFGRIISTEGGHQSLEVFKLTCSKKDPFYKRLAHSIYGVYLLKGIEVLNATGFHPEVYAIPIADIDRPKWSFLSHCSSEYFHLKEWYFPFIGNNLPTVHIFAGQGSKYSNEILIKSLVK